MNKIKIIELSMCRDLVAACVNSDFSGLNDEDIKALENFESGFKYFHVRCPENSQTDFKKCEITGLFSDCLDVSIEVKE